MKPGGIVGTSDGCSNSRPEKIWERVDEIGFISKWWTIKELENVMKNVGFKQIEVKFLKYKFNILPSVIIEDVKREKISNLPNLIIYLKKIRKEIEKTGLEFPTEYILFGRKIESI